MVVRRPRSARGGELVRGAARAQVGPSHGTEEEVAKARLRGATQGVPGPGEALPPQERRPVPAPREPRPVSIDGETTPPPGPPPGTRPPGCRGQGVAFSMAWADWGPRTGQSPTTIRRVAWLGRGARTESSPTTVCQPGSTRCLRCLFPATAVPARPPGGRVSGGGQNKARPFRRRPHCFNHGGPPSVGAAPDEVGGRFLRSGKEFGRRNRAGD
jgi:hypothetical protein